MDRGGYAISQQTLVSSVGDPTVPAKRLPQYTAGLAATLGALASGMVLGWTSSAGDNGVDLQELYGIPISADEFSWIGSLATLGGGVICIPIGILADIIGRKYSLLLMTLPFLLGWLLLIFANSVVMFYIGRFITGLSGGAFCVVAPMYTAEISQKEIRGKLGTYYQLLLTIGILLSYILGSFVNMRILSIISAIVPIVFCVVFVFMPETPTYYLIKENEEAARKSFIKLRGPNYYFENELRSQQEAIDEIRQNKIPFTTLVKSRATVKALIAGYGLMFFQQLSGVNAIIFYSTSIFHSAGSDLKPAYSTIIVGVMQVAAVFVSALIVDRSGRRILLVISVIFLGLANIALGIYFYLTDVGEDVTNLKWLPLVSVCVFIILFNLGFGPIPWLMVGEIFQPEVKSIVGGSVCLFNWLMAFVVTKFFTDMKVAFTTAGTFWFFAAICAVGLFFVWLIVPETKNKSLEDIQKELSGSQ